MKKLSLLLVSLLFAVHSFAKEIEIKGTEHQTITIKKPSSHHGFGYKAPSFKKDLSYWRVELSPHAEEILKNKYALLAKQTTGATPASGATRVQLGMNGVPVLDQGKHGSCATFAATATIDAVLNQGDFVSQLCLLQLGNHLETNGYQLSGWDGTLPEEVFHTIKKFGVINKANEAKGCGGLTQYPSNDEPPETEMTLPEYHALSQPVDEQVAWTSLLDIYQLGLDKIDSANILSEIKSALNKGDRVTASFLLFVPKLGVVGAVGQYHSPFDTWIVTEDLWMQLILMPEFGGHAMIITGFDDEAVVVDKQGRTHKGLVTLRNSWGDDVGDKGDFYMSYDYFKLAILGAMRVRALV